MIKTMDNVLSPSGLEQWVRHTAWWVRPPPSPGRQTTQHQHPQMFPTTAQRSWCVGSPSDRSCSPGTDTWAAPCAVGLVVQTPRPWAVTAPPLFPHWPWEQHKHVIDRHTHTQYIRSITPVLKTFDGVLECVCVHLHSVDVHLHSIDVHVHGPDFLALTFVKMQFSPRCVAVQSFGIITVAPVLHNQICRLWYTFINKT